jgi:hypothetical protein
VSQEAINALGAFWFKNGDMVIEFGKKITRGFGIETGLCFFSKISTTDPSSFYGLNFV